MILCSGAILGPGARGRKWIGCPFPEQGRQSHLKSCGKGNGGFFHQEHEHIHEFSEVGGGGWGFIENIAAHNFPPCYLSICAPLCPLRSESKKVKSEGKVCSLYKWSDFVHIFCPNM